MQLYDNFYHHHEDALKDPESVKGIVIAGINWSPNLPDLLKFPNLEAIDVQARSLQWTPDEIAILQQCKNLRAIRLLPDRTHREPLPTSLAQLPQLEKLVIKELYERMIPEAIFELPNLKDIELVNVNRNTIQEFLKRMANIKGLERLSLTLQFERGNEVFPEDMLNGIKALSSLRHLELTGWPAWPEAIRHLPKLESLALTSNTSKGAPTPDWIWELTQLRSLKLTHTLLDTLPAAIGEFRQLETLLIRLNPITAVPDVICDLPNLKHLNLSNTNITQLPEHIGNLKGLETLEVHSSALTSLPASIAELKNLNPVFNLTSTQLKAFPEELCTMTHLTSLDFSHHPITELPDSIAQLTNLQVLNLRGCKFEEFPKVLLKMSTLDEVTLLQNPMTRGATGKKLKKLVEKKLFGPKNRHLSPAQKEKLLQEAQEAS